jgi:hypothetical protein
MSPHLPLTGRPSPHWLPLPGSRQRLRLSERLLQISLTLRERLNGAHHPLLATTYADLAAVYLKRIDRIKGRPQYAHDDGEEREKIVEAGGDGDTVTRDAVDDLEDVEDLTVDELVAKATEMAERALHIRAITLGEEHPFYARSAQYCLP